VYIGEDNYYGLEDFNGINNNLKNWRYTEWNDFQAHIFSTNSIEINCISQLNITIGRYWTKINHLIKYKCNS